MKTKPLHERNINSRGYSFSELLKGQIYTVNERSVLFCEETGEVYDHATRTEITDDAVVSAVMTLIDQDKETLAAREAFAVEMSNGDPILARVLTWHLWFNTSLGNPYRVEGVDFYEVGRNSSHQFYAGVKDGQRYRMSSGYDSTYDEKGEPILDSHGYEVEELVQNVSEVSSFDGYYGHC